jgi:hypothetical protein
MTTPTQTAAPVKPGPGRRLCSSCGAAVKDRPGPAYCLFCFHRIDLPREQCDCAFCQAPGRRHAPNEVIDLSQDFDQDGEPVPALEPAVSEGTARNLVGVEYDFCQADARLSEIQQMLLQSAAEAPHCQVAARQVQTIRRMLRRILDALDADVTAAVAALELISPPPF